MGCTCENGSLGVASVIAAQVLESMGSDALVEAPTT